jgi:hypothetical protein
MKARLTVLLAGCLLGAAAPAFAHHSFAAEYDDKKPLTIDGFRAKDGTNTCNSRSVKLPEGKHVYAGSADNGRPAARGQAKQ